jgi:predicted dehydrogenase
MTLRWDTTIKRLLQEGVLGSLVQVDIRGVSGQHANSSTLMHWRNDYELSGSNTMTLGIYYEALRRWVGSATRVTAMASNVVKQRANAAGELAAVRIPDHLEVLGRLAFDGAQLHMMISDVVAGGGRPAAEIWLHGTSADLHLDLTQKKLTLYRITPSGERIGSDVDVPDHAAGSWRVEEEFIGAIRGQEKITHTRCDPLSL